MRRPAAGARALAAALVLALGLAALPVATAHAGIADAESRMLGHINSARSADGLAALAPHGGLREIARGWAARMAADHDASGDRRGALRHNPSLSSQLPGEYRRAGENVGYTVLTGASHAELVDRLHDSYMGSPAHRANIMGDYDQVGVGLVTSDDGTMWSAVVFMLGKDAPAEKSGSESDGGDKSAQSSGGSADRSRADGSRSGGDRGDSGGRPSGSRTGRSQAARASADAPPPEPPTTEQLFGAAWPEGYLAGDRDAALALLAGRREPRGTVSLVGRLPAASAPRLLGHQVGGV